MAHKKLLRKSLKLAGIALQCGCVAHCLLEFVGDFVVCCGLSMEPTIYSGDIVLTEHVSAILHRYARGDIVIARSPSDPQVFICKRVIALPGDKVDRKMLVPKGHIWLGGDNQSNSLDSWTYGPVPQGLIRGRVICKVWPWRDMQMFSSGRLP